jgi:Flp pilus assembly pilin Flp
MRCGIGVALVKVLAAVEEKRQLIKKRPYGGTEVANLLKRLWVEQDGQGLVEYTLVVLLVAMVFWLGVKDSEIGGSLTKRWDKVVECVASPMSCSV